MHPYHEIWSDHKWFFDLSKWFSSIQARFFQKVETSCVETKIISSKGFQIFVLIKWWLWIVKYTHIKIKNKIFQYENVHFDS